MCFSKIFHVHFKLFSHYSWDVSWCVIVVLMVFIFCGVFCNVLIVSMRFSWCIFCSCSIHGCPTVCFQVPTTSMRCFMVYFGCPRSNHEMMDGAFLFFPHSSWDVSWCIFFISFTYCFLSLLILFKMSSHHDLISLYFLIPCMFLVHH